MSELAAKKMRRQDASPAAADLVQFAAKKWIVPDRASRMANDKKFLNCLSFFSGAMGLDIGLHHAGLNILLACELDKFCRSTISANCPDIGLIGDICAYTPQEILRFAGLRAGEVDVIVGGPPCQAFSTAGKRKGFEDVRGNVFLRFIDMALALQPKYLVIENVRGLLSAPLRHRPHEQRSKDAPLLPDEQAGGALRHIVSRLELAGYGVSFNLYNAANFGVPQSRERVIMLCHRGGDRLPYLVPTHAQSGQFGLPHWRTVRDAIGALDDADDHIDFPETRLKYYRMLKAGEYWRHLPTHLQQEALGASYFAGGGKTGFLRRLSWDKPSCTLVTHPAMPATDICHPEADRPLSVSEYKRIQQFPDDWKLAGSLIDQYRQLGNAVPVGLGEAVGRAILAHAQNHICEPPLGFAFSRYKKTDDRAFRAEHGLYRQYDLCFAAE